MIVADPSAIVALIDRHHPHHATACAAVERSREAVVVPAATLAAVDHWVGREIGPRAIDVVLGAFLDGSLLLDCGDVDPPRMRDLLARDLGVDLTDAAVAACAERHGASILSVEPSRRRALRRSGTATLLP